MTAVQLLLVNQFCYTGLGNGLGNTSNRPGVGLSQNKSGTGGNRGDSNDDLTDGLDRVKSSHSNTSRPGSSRPVSSRPASRIGSGVGGRRGGYERKNRKGGSTSMEVNIPSTGYRV